ncbi:site-specific integrase [Staphylococcus pseudintermedius]|uniref:tyrosine-type recombinase/integrase n=1 Tax=Staphylococcus pseudintermedius TaxID=283734 RepID=UPI000D73DE1B|nr:tyrosine-type recombinase/integrase [Staphylococcus pseudintermedius]EGQ3120957.1 site-specific integrase [Staphylococcus pseudintermedius]MDK3919383.1 tyrosine-type recombinase/integrase [Staphylococcus pseudintermedius]PXA06144.1 site-specific integrase [Staphylococcus pseudintermedius]PXA61821.1 site-specific integrase [Staphylococcus pseudintermedius]RYS13030.1 site-specific integrase [Staphylococcus pseudintermedius]
MATYEKRGNTWRYRISTGKNPTTGKYKYISKSGFKRKSDAKHHAEMIERQLRTGEYIAPSSSTFKQVADDWLKQYANDVKVSSVRAREKAIYHAIQRFGTYPIQSIKKRDYQRFVDDMSLQYSKNYVDSIVASTNMIFKYAYDMKLIKVLPSEGIKRPKKKRTVEELEDTEIHKKFLEKDELFEFLQVAKYNHSPQNSFEVFTTLAYTGMRAGELLALKWADIDFENNTINITKTYYNPNNNKKKYQILTPKTESSIGKISVDPNVIKMLREYKINVQANWKDELYEDNNFVFTDNNGYPLVIKKLQLWIKAILKKTNINKNISTHSFRHTHCALLIEAGVHIKEIQERLRHKDINTTMNIYAKITNSYKKDASEKFSKLMENVSQDLF